MRQNRSWPRAALLAPLMLCAAARTDDSPGRRDADESELREYLSGNGLLNRGLYELAAAEYRKFLTGHAEHAKASLARYGLAVCLYRTQDYDAALPELKRLSEPASFEYAAEVATMLGLVALARQHYDAAVETLDRVVRDHPKHDLADDAAAGAVEALYRKGDLAAALEHGRTFSSRWPESPLTERVEFFCALVEMGRRDYAAAGARAQRLLGKYPNGQFADRAALLLAQCDHQTGKLDKAADEYRALAQRTDDPNLPEVLLGLGSLLLQQGRPREAGALLDQLLEKQPDGPSAPSASLQRGRAWFDEGRFDRAFESFERVARGPADLADDAAYWTAKCRLRQEQFADAAARLNRAIEQFPRSELLPEMYFDRAVALTRMDAANDAVALLETFLSRFSEHALAPNALQLLAVSEHQRRRFDESAAHCRAFLSRFPSHELAGTISFLLAENQFLAGKLADAAESFRQFLGQHPGDAQARQARLRLGTALYRLDRADDAAAVLREFADLTAKDETLRPALLMLGDIAFARSEWKLAEQYLGGYLAGGLDLPSADDALLKLGLAQQRQGRLDEAVRAYDRLIERFERSPHRLQAIFERGQALLALKRPDDAARAFERVLADGGDSRFAPYAQNHLAAIAADRHDFEAAAQRFERVAHSGASDELAGEAAFGRAHALLAARKYPEADAAFGAFLQRSPADPRAPSAAAEQAIALSRQDRHEEALTAIEKVEGQSGDKLDAALRTAVQYEKAWCLRALGRTDQAADAYRRLLAGKTEGELAARALLDLAAIEADAKRYDGAEDLLHRLRTIIESDSSKVPDDVQEQAAYRLGVCAYELHRFADAAEWLESFMGKFTASALLPSASFMCGDALIRQGKHEPAAAHLRRVAERYPSDPACPPSLLRLGECMATLARWPQSERAFADYLDRFADGEQWFAARFGLGWARENQERYDEAIAAYQAVVARHKGPTAARAQFQIGECLFAQKKYEPAAAELLKVDILYAYPEWSAAALYEAGRCFDMLSKPADARAQFKTVVEKFKDTRWAELASKQLTQ